MKLRSVHDFDSPQLLWECLKVSVLQLYDKHRSVAPSERAWQHTCYSLYAQVGPVTQYSTHFLLVISCYCPTDVTALPFVGDKPLMADGCDARKTSEQDASTSGMLYNSAYPTRAVNC